jgi:hypothetical protein
MQAVQAEQLLVLASSFIIIGAAYVAFWWHNTAVSGLDQLAQHEPGRRQSMTSSAVGSSAELAVQVKRPTFHEGVVAAWNVVIVAHLLPA